MKKGIIFYFGLLERLNCRDIQHKGFVSKPCKDIYENKLETHQLDIGGT